MASSQGWLALMATWDFASLVSLPHWPHCLIGRSKMSIQLRSHMKLGTEVLHHWNVVKLHQSSPSSANTL